MKKVHFNLIVIAIVLSPLFSFTYASSPSQQHGGQWQEDSISFDGTKRFFRYLAPSRRETKRSSQQAKLVILLHGGTQSMNKLFKKRSGGSQHWQTLAEKYQFTLMVPNGVNPKTNDTNGNKQNWNDCRPPTPKSGDRQSSVANDVKFVSKLIDWSVERLKIDKTQVFVTGASNGGMMTFRLAEEIPEKITAAATFIANRPLPSECHSKNQPVPIIMVNGTDDPLMPFTGGELKFKGGQVSSSEQTFNYWAKVNHSKLSDLRTFFIANINQKDKSHIEGMCAPKTLDRKQSAETCLYTVKGGGHTMPSIKHSVPRWLQRTLLNAQNHDIEGTDLAWSFFDSF